VEAEIRRALTPLLEKPVRPEEVAEHLLAIAGSDRYDYLTYSVTLNPRPTALQNWHSDASVGLILETLLGPVSVGGSIGFTGHSRIYIALGPLVR
jgi:hypothetical protein